MTGVSSQEEAEEENDEEADDCENQETGSGLSEQIQKLVSDLFVEDVALGGEEEPREEDLFTEDCCR